MNKTFNEDDVKKILAIPLSALSSNDELTWALTKNEDYLVKTAYMLGKGGNLDNFHHAWVHIWGADTSSKVRHFFWILCTNSLHVRALLH